MSPSSTVTVKLLFLTVPTAFLLCGALNAKETVYDCNFDKDNCGWIFSSENSLLKWERRSKGDPAKGHGPVREVTGTGYFMNLRVSQEKSPTNVTVKSPVMKSTASSTSCQLRFSYSLYKSIPVHCQNSKGNTACEKQYGNFKNYVCNPNSGDKMMLDAIMKECAQFCGFKCPQLEVMVSAGGVSEKLKLSPPIVFSEIWDSVDVSIPQKFTGNDMTVAIEAVTGWDVDSFIAVDNISFTGCKFPSNNPTTEKQTTVSTTAAFTIVPVSLAVSSNMDSTANTVVQRKLTTQKLDTSIEGLIRRSTKLAVESTMDMTDAYSTALYPQISAHTPQDPNHMPTSPQNIKSQSKVPFGIQRNRSTHTSVPVPTVTNKSDKQVADNKDAKERSLRVDFNFSGFFKILTN